jgi:hypothetical protein
MLRGRQYEGRCARVSACRACFSGAVAPYSSSGVNQSLNAPTRRILHAGARCTGRSQSSLATREAGQRRGDSSRPMGTIRQRSSRKSYARRGKARTGGTACGGPSSCGQDGRLRAREALTPPDESAPHRVDTRAGVTSPVECGRPYAIRILHDTRHESAPLRTRAHRDSRRPPRDP